MNDLYTNNKMVDKGGVPNVLTLMAIEDAHYNIDLTTIEDLKLYKQTLIDGIV